jgi:hypothetical protein
MILNKQKLLKSLLKLKSAQSLISLRNGLLKLKDQLNDTKVDGGGLLETSSNGNSVEYDRELLMEELDQIEESLTIKRAKYYIERLEKGIKEVKTARINDINLNRWKEYDDIITDSLWILERRDSSGVHTADYWGNFIPQIPNQIMRRYTRRGDWVLDTFVGSGTTLIESQRLGRNGIGIELQEKIAERARELISAEPNGFNVVSEVVVGDSSAVDYGSILKRQGSRSVQLVIMHPPYFDIIKFSKDPRDLSNAPSVESFIEMIGRVARNALSVLEKGRYLVLVIGDKYSRGEWIPLGFLAMNELLKLDLSLKSIVVKNFEETAGKRTQKELWKYRALAGGFYIFKHEYIFLFKK